jgi:preprotein translocase subunit SecA
MAGRGTDIKLGEGVGALGGLFVIGTERNPSRRVDRQLRGRCSRQGDPGRSQFFLSLEDDLMRHRAAPGRMASVIEQSEAAGAKIPSLGKLVEAAQCQAEQHDAQIRKRVLDFDDVMNLQREIVYGYRNDVLTTEDTAALVHEIIGEMVAAGVRQQLAEAEDFDPNPGELVGWVRDVFAVSLNPDELRNAGGEAIVTRTVERVRDAHDQRIAGLPAELVEAEIRRAVLHAIDSRWQEHLADMDELREGVYLRSQGQKDPLVEYKNEAFGLFHALMDSIKQQALVNLRIMAPVAM